jgi:23S rRNA (cytidine2498-2'-O)-methyltransferase
VPAFVLATCRPDATAWLRDEVARDTPALRMSWSRPGVVTFRIPDDATPDPAVPLTAVFARATGLSIGFAKDDSEVMTKIADAPLAGPVRVHVYARDPRDEERWHDPDPRPAEWTRKIVDMLGARALEGDLAADGDTVLDVVLPPVELAQDPIVLGWHVHRPPRVRTAGGVVRVPLPDDVPSRAYVKLEEALAWSGAPVQAGDVAVEIGAAPGGAAFALLRRDLDVIAIDPARLDARVTEYDGRGQLRHLRVLAERVRTRDLPDRVDWLLLDANVSPHRALVAVEHLLALRRTTLRGLLLTLKLNDDGVVRDLPELFARIAKFTGGAPVRATQLPSAHREVVAWVPLDPS